MAFIIIFKPSNPIRKYNGFISSAKTFIESKNWKKADDALEKAKEIKNTPEIERLLAEIAGNKRIENMKREFDDLKTFLNGQARNKDKLKKCREFLGNYQSIPVNKDIQEMRDDTNRFISKLNVAIQNGEQYQKSIDAVNNLIKSEEYEKAEKELNKARMINDSEEVKRLSATITQGLERERKNGDKKYNAIKDKLTLSQYQAFQRNYPNSDHLPDLQNGLMGVDNKLPPEEYWDQKIEKNEMGYYEFTFEEHNGHQMIYIPEKGIWIDKYEVSWAQFRKFLKEAKIQFTSIKDNPFICRRDECPAVVTDEDAKKYCQRYGLRLPSIDEWEYAAGKGKYIYPWGNEPPDYKGIWRANCSGALGNKKETVSVNSFKEFASHFGVVQMAGNVWEWVIVGEAVTVKGGGFLSDKDGMKIENRPTKGITSLNGFRCIKGEK